MPDLTLTEGDQTVFRAVMGAEPLPGRGLPDEATLTLIDQLIPCDEIGVVIADNQGRVVDRISLGTSVVGDDEHGDGPFYVGLMHWSRHPREAAACGTLVGTGDGVAIGFRNGPHQVTQIWWDRHTRRFTAADLARMRLIAPLLERLLRHRVTPPLPVGLTPQERRVLMLVANGLSNDQIAGALFVAPSTVRKHLENAYRKLGVNSRIAAVIALEGRQLDDPDRITRVQRFA